MAGEPQLLLVEDDATQLTTFRDDAEIAGTVEYLVQFVNASGMNRFQHLSMRCQSRC